MNYDLSKLGENRNSSPYLTYGSGQVLKINDIELKYSKNTGSPRAILHMETAPITMEGFTPAEGFQGRVGKVACGIYMKDEYAKTMFLRRLLTIAIALDVDEEVNKIKSNSFESVVSSISKIFADSKKFAKYTLFAEEYAKQNGKGITLFLPRNNFVEKVDTDPTTLVQFDRNDPYHYKKLPEVERPESFHDNGTSGVKDNSDISDLPF